MSRYIIILLIALIPASLSAQDGSSKELYALHKEYKRKMSKDTSSVNTLLKIGKWHLKASSKKAFPKSGDSIRFYADRAFALSKTINYEKGEGKCHLFYAELATAERKMEDAKSNAERALEIFQKLGYKEGIADANFLIYSAYRGKSDENIIKKLIGVKEIYEQTGDKEKEGNTLRQISAVYLDLGDMDKSLSYARESVQLFTGHPASEVLVKNLVQLVMLNHYTGKMEESLKYAIQAAELAEQLDPLGSYTGYCFSQLGILFYYQKKSEQALPNLIKAYTISQLYTDRQAEVMSAGNIIMVLIDLKRYDEALTYLKPLENIRDLDLESRISVIARSITVYNNLKQYGNSKNYVAQAEKILKDYPEGMITVRLYTPVGLYYYNTERYDRSRQYFEKYKLWAEKSNNKTTLSFIHSQLFKIDSIQNAYGSALKNLKLSQKYNDSVFNEQSQKRIDELNIKYDVTKKERDLQLHEKNNKILAKQNELQQEKLAESNVARNISIAGTVVVVIVLGLLYNRHKTNKRNNSLLQKQQAEILDSNKTLQHMVSEKEWLLKEIHHRVKNNLHMIMSLLNSQSYFLEDESALSAIKNSQHRIQSMSLIHQKLYMADGLSTIRMREYITDLIEYLSDSFSNKKNVKFNITVEDIEMDVSQAVPIGLILNEAITNSFKYAFAQGKGNISVFLTNTAADIFCLEISDNGIGLPRGFDIMESKSLGMKLIKGLTEDLGGTLNIASSSEGVAIKIEFAYRQLLFEKYK